MNQLLSPADLDHCIRRGVISRSEGMFLSHVSSDTQLSTSYKCLFDNICAKVKEYAGIAQKASVMKEYVATKNQELKAYKTAARTAYADRNQSTPGSFI